ncbi:DUF1684 domain-containing protein [Spirosoma pollinicola]|uniref:DUF1684 domain-containing protein n=1 Tax=Spirosoma pollinicola TaxID=2057025 RepID=A0A2K8YYH8_9BACT|nr:DUF1684 domain-containing protein [Spirosoma pollinicola]AUD02693.1 hypothetical protein CWM47_13105 [Spirosoma pollinicola]
MLKNKFFLTGLFLLIAIVLYYTAFDGGSSSAVDGLEVSVNPETYRQQIDEKRTEKDQFLRTNTESPIPDKAGFKGLTYFLPDPAYRVVARLEPFADKTQKLVVSMSDGSEDVYEKFAHAVFSLNGEACRLLVVKLGSTYSILFRDGTSGKDTYGGGRYIELDPAQLSDNHAIIDFNTAYNPYCAYNPTYACPLPPAENKLSIAVKAGEKYITHE